MVHNNKNKIIIFAYDMGDGGLGKQVALLSSNLVQIGFDVNIILWSNIISYETSAKIVNLDLLFEKSTFYIKFKKYFYLRNFIISNKINLLIDFRYRKKPFLELFLSKLIFKTKIIYTIHSSLIDHYGFKINWLVKFIFKNNPIVGVSNCIIENVKKQHPSIKNLWTIYNFTDKNKVLSKFNPDYEYILFCGRIHSEEKQVELLIKSFKDAKIYTQVHLILLGYDGKTNDLHQLVKEYQIENYVHFVEFTQNVDVYYEKALFTILCSKFEGFGMVLVESLLNNTPVVSFDCPCGPSEIIKHNINGVLVKNQDFNQLSQVILELINNRERLNVFKMNIDDSISEFSKKSILDKWTKLINYSI